MMAGGSRPAASVLLSDWAASSAFPASSSATAACTAASASAGEDFFLGASLAAPFSSSLAGCASAGLALRATSPAAGNASPAASAIAAAARACVRQSEARSLVPPEVGRTEPFAQSRALIALPRIAVWNANHLPWAKLCPFAACEANGCSGGGALILFHGHRL